MRVEDEVVDRVATPATALELDLMEDAAADADAEDVTPLMEEVLENSFLVEDEYDTEEDVQELTATGVDEALSDTDPEPNDTDTEVAREGEVPHFEAFEPTAPFEPFETTAYSEVTLPTESVEAEAGESESENEKEAKAKAKAKADAEEDKPTLE